MARLGWTSDTGDRDGELAHTGRMPDGLTIPTGEQLQRPPAYSAVKVGGGRAYELARARRGGRAPARPVTVHRAELLSHDDEHARFEIECSSGTYVRSLVTELGTPTATSSSGPRSGRSGSRTPTPARWSRCAEALAFLPERVLEPPRQAR